MKSRILLVCVALLSLFILACPMPQVGKGPTKDLAGGTDQAAPLAAGATISVVDDVARNQAVYINEAGLRFDVAAAEYPGGPLVSCVQVAGFTLVPPSTDSDALPVKALVAGTRNDGSPGVWEIHSDDTIDLPQPAVDDSSGARCIVGGNMTTLPSGVQINLGWGFHVTAVSPDGKMIVGYADNPKGVNVGGVQILPGTTIGVYWRVYSQLGSRFCIVSPPSIIGSFVKQPLPAKWAARWPGRSELLERLRLYFAGTLQSYLVNESSVRLDIPQGVTAAVAGSTGEYDVLGTNEDGLPALAQIQKNGSVSIEVYVPDLAVSAVTLSTSTTAVTPPVNTSDSWSVSATLTNEGTAPAYPVTVQYWLSTSATLDETTAKLLDTSTMYPTSTTGFQPGATVAVTSPQTYSLDKLGLAAGTYYIAVTVSTDLKLGEIDLSDNEAQTSVTLQGKASSIAYNEVFIDTYDPTGGGADAKNNTKIDLYGSDGTLLGSDDGFTTNRGYSVGYAFIDYMQGGVGVVGTYAPLVSGDYYVLIQASSPGDSFGYGIRVLAQSSSAYGPDWAVTTAVETQSDSPLVGSGAVSARVDQTIVLGVSPTGPAPNAKLGRYIPNVTPPGVNWVKIHLP